MTDYAEGGVDLGTFSEAFFVPTCDYCLVVGAFEGLNPSGFEGGSGGWKDQGAGAVCGGGVSEIWGICA